MNVKGRRNIKKTQKRRRETESKEKKMSVNKKGKNIKKCQQREQRIFNNSKARK